jgi:MFS family permease
MVEFGWDRGFISLAFFLNMTIYALSIIVAGRAYDKYGPKWVIIISNIFLSSGFMSLAYIDSSLEFFIFYGILAALGMGGTTVPLFAALTSKWFEKGRGFAVSLGLAGSCLGQFVLVPLFTILVMRYGWRVSYFYLGLTMLVIIMGLVFWLIKGDPIDMGLQPWGHQNGAELQEETAQEPAVLESRDLGLTDAMKTYSFWLFLTFMLICGSGDFMVTTHLIPMVTDYDIPPATAGNMLAWLGLMSLAGILIAGPVSDKIGTKIPIAVTFLIRFVLFLLFLRYQSTISLYVFACSFGFTLLVTAPLTVILVGRLYGFSHIGLISGFITTVHHIGGGCLTYVAGEIFDRTGSYSMAFILSAIMALIALLCTVLIKETRHQVPG